MFIQKFYFGQDIVDQQKEFRISQNTPVQRTNSEIRLNTKSRSQKINQNSSSPISKTQISHIRNMTELQNSKGQSQGQIQLNKKQNQLLNNLKRQINFTDTSDNQSVSLIRKVEPISKHKIGIKNLKAKLNQITVDEKGFLEQLKNNNQNISIRQSQTKLKSQERSKRTQLITQSEFSVEKSRKPMQQSQTSIRSKELFRDYRKNQEQKIYDYKLILAFHYSQQITNKHMDIEDFIDPQEKFISFMNLRQNLVNLPLNIQGLENVCRTYKYLHKALKPSISPILEAYILDSEQIIKKITLTSQLFYIFINHSEMTQTVSNEIVKFILPPSPEYLQIVNKIENNMMIFNKNKSFDDSVQIIEEYFQQSYEQLLMEAKSFYSLQFDTEFMKIIYCFTNKVSETLSNKILGESQQTEAYDRSFDFIEALKKLKYAKNNDEQKQLFRKFKLFKTELPTQLEEFERKFGKLDSVSNLQRQLARLADLKQQMYNSKLQN